MSDGFGSGNILRYNAATGAFLDALSQPGVFPFDMAFGPDGLLYVVNGTANASVVRFNPATGAFVDTFIPSGSGLAFPSGLTFGPDGSLYIGIGGEGGADNRVLRFNGTTLSTFASPVPSVGPSFLTDITFGPDNHLYVSGFVNGTVLRYNGTTGDFVDVFATGSFGLTGLAFTPRRGEVASDPLLPDAQQGTAFVFSAVPVTPFRPRWFDPPVAVGYDYVVTSGPHIQSVQLLNIGDGLFDLYLFDTGQNDFVFNTVLEAGIAHDFGLGGVDRFRILGIEPDAGLDATDPTAFPTGLTFVSTGAVTLTMTPITAQQGFLFSGFFPPVDNPPTLNAVQGGQAVPLKFSLGGDQGLDILAAGYPVSQRITCDTSAPVSDVEQTVAAGGSSLTYDSSTDQDTYVWKTSKSWAGTCRQLTVRLTDGTDHVASFKFK